MTLCSWMDQAQSARLSLGLLSLHRVLSPYPRPSLVGKLDQGYRKEMGAVYWLFKIQGSNLPLKVALYTD